MARRSICRIGEPTVGHHGMAVAVGNRGLRGSTRSSESGIRNTGMGRRRYAWVGVFGLALGCDAPPADVMVGTTGSEGSSSGEVETTAPLPDVGEPEPQLRCPTPAGHTGRPQSIEEAVAHIKALPAPVDVPCVLESFARPLPLLASSSVFSAQPGRGDRSPRLFVFFDGLILSFATHGYGAHLVEFAEFIGPTTTVKGELEMPLEPDALELDMVFTRVLDEDNGTVCRLCHRGEELVEEIYPGAFASDALAPRADTILELDVVREPADHCDLRKDPHRCAVFDAVFEHGEVVDGEFDPEIQTIFDYE